MGFFYKEKQELLKNLKHIYMAVLLNFNPNTSQYCKSAVSRLQNENPHKLNSASGYKIFTKQHTVFKINYMGAPDVASKSVRTPVTVLVLVFDGPQARSVPHLE